MMGGRQQGGKRGREKDAGAQTLQRTSNRGASCGGARCQGYRPHKGGRYEVHIHSGVQAVGRTSVWVDRCQAYLTSKLPDFPDAACSTAVERMNLRQPSKLRF